MAALTIGLVGCNDDTPFFPQIDTTTDTGSRDTGGTMDTGGSDTGGTTDTGTADTITPEVGIPDVPTSDAGTDAAPGDTGTDPGRAAAIEALTAAWISRCEAQAACYDYDPAGCPEYIEGYLEYLGGYSTECLEAFTEYADCTTETGECTDGEFNYDCEDEYSAVADICEL